MWCSLEVQGFGSFARIQILITAREGELLGSAAGIDGDNFERRPAKLRRG